MEIADIARYVLVGASVVFLVFVWNRGRRLSARALAWCQEQTKVLDGLVKEKNPGAAHNSPITPNPIRDRADLLSRMRGSPLMEGDIGAFILRRREVAGEADAGYHATLLVSWALFFTILGLIFTLHELYVALSVPGTAVTGEPLDVLMARVQAPLSHLPLLFVPTGIGLLLAVSCTGRQAKIEGALETAWQATDQYTDTTLIPHYITPQGTVAESTRAFAQSTESLRATFESVDRALKELGHLDQSQWARDLIAAAADFRTEVAQSGQVLTASSQELSSTLRGLPDVAQAMGASATQVSEAGQGLAAVSQQTHVVIQTLATTVERANAAQEQVLELNANVSALTTVMNALQASFLDWSQSQGEQVANIGRMVRELNESVAPLLTGWKVVSEQIIANAETSREALNGARDQLALTCEQLGGILTTQQAAFAAVATQVADSLREGHQRFLAEVGDRFDQGEGLYQRLDSLSQALESHQSGLGEHARALEGFGADIRALPALLDSYCHSIAGMQETAQVLQGTMAQLPALLQQRDAEHQRQLLGVMGELKDPLRKLDGLPSAIDALTRATQELARRRQWFTPWELERSWVVGWWVRKQRQAKGR